MLLMRISKIRGIDIKILEFFDKLNMPSSEMPNALNVAIHLCDFLYLCTSFCCYKTKVLLTLLCLLLINDQAGAYVNPKNTRVKCTPQMDFFWEEGGQFQQCLFIVALMHRKQIYSVVIELFRVTWVKTHRVRIRVNVGCYFYLLVKIFALKHCENQTIHIY